MSLLSKLFSSKTPEKPESSEKLSVDLKHITCPYCFETFEHYNVHFRVHPNSVQGTVLSDDDITDRYGYDEERLNIELKKARIARRFQRQTHDEKLSNFWENRFHIRPEQRDDKDWNLPVITPEDTSMLFHESEKEGRIFSDDDQNRFLYMLKDYYGNPATVRLCPHCHNVISGTYGKYPVEFITVVGITGSGKTVYLNQLIKDLGSNLSRGGLSPSGHFNMREIDKVKKGKFLPMSTQEGVMYPPMMVDIQPVKQGVKQKRTLVFYDIAGENCTDTGKLLSFGPYLEKSKAIILLMDPKQFLTFNEDAGDNPATLVVDALVGFFTMREASPYIAATLSKSDVLKKLASDITLNEIIREDSIMFKKIDWRNSAKGFYQKSYGMMAGEMTRLRQHIDPDSELDSRLKKEFKDRAYFAVSALGVDVQPQYNIGTVDSPRYININEETADNIEILLKGTGEEPSYYEGEPKLYIGIDPKTNQEIILRFREIIDLGEHPRYLMTSDPEPYRIEEPLLWILYKLGIVEAVEA